MRFSITGPGRQLNLRSYPKADIAERGQNVRLVPWLFSNSGPVVKLSMNILAGSRVLSAVGTRPPHDGVR